ncbi:MAG: ATP-binding protein [Microscillaceae bacterium]|nr:ATP-binding protein [Microscillaceae bacterium]
MRDLNQSQLHASRVPLEKSESHSYYTDYTDEGIHAHTFEHIFEKTPQPILLVDKHTGQIVLINQSGRDLLKISSSQLAPSYKEIFQSPFWDSLAGIEEGLYPLEGQNKHLTTFEGKVDIRLFDQTQRHLLVFYLYPNSGYPHQSVQVKKENYKQNTGNLLKTLLSHIHDGVVIFDTKGTPLIYNKAAEKFLDDLTDQADEGTSIFGVSALPDRKRYTYQDLSLKSLNSSFNQEYIELEIKNRHYPEGIFVDSIWATITDFRNNKIGTLSVFQDIHLNKIYEQDLMKKIQFEKLLTEISSFFIKYDLDELSREIHQILHQIASFFGYDGAFMVLSSSKSYPQSQVFSCQVIPNDFLKEFLARTQFVEFSWFVEQIKQNTDLQIDSITQIPSQAVAERDFFVGSNIQNLILVPVVSSKYAQGCIVLYSSQNQKHQADICKRLRLLMEIIMSALQREEKEKEIRSLNTYLEQRVLQRTQELEESNQFLEEEMNNRLSIQKELVRKTLQLEAANREMESFSYSVSHDLRAPLRGINGFSKALLEDYAGQLDDTAHDYLNRIILASQKMGKLIDGLLNLSHLSRKELHLEKIDLSKLAENILSTLIESEPERAYKIYIKPGLVVYGDAKMIEIALENLLSNAWKFSSLSKITSIELGSFNREDQDIFYLKDQGVGFDMQYAKHLFRAFYRLHSAEEFKGSGIGLATVKRIINRHGGHIWAEASPGKGATFYFILNTKLG